MRYPALFLAALWLWSTSLNAAVPAPRIISLAPSLTEIVMELGGEGQLVGVLDGGERPAGLESVPSVGAYGQYSLEGLVALKPDLILGWDGSPSVAQEQRLRSMGYSVYRFSPRNFEQLADDLYRIGTLIGRDEQGRVLGDRLRVQVAELRRTYHRDSPLRVFYQVWDQPLYTLGGNQIVADALEVCGGRSLFADLALPAPQVSLESVLARNPQVILAHSTQQLGSWMRWKRVDAVRLNQLWLVSDGQLERPSFGMLEATRKLCEQLARAQP